jgi:iron complex transport system substrate-binding protein
MTVVRSCAVALLLFLVDAAEVRADRVESIVSLAPSVTEILFALGVGDRVVGVSTYCDYPERAKQIDQVGNFLQPNVELILRKQPDLVIAVPSPANRVPVESLNDLGLRVLVVDPDGIAEIYAAIGSIAAAVGEVSEGERLVRDIRARVDRVTGRLAGAPRRRVLMLVGRSPLIAAGSGTYQNELIVLARGTNVAADAGSAWPNLSLELIIAAAPEVIIDAGMGSEEEDTQSGRAYWQKFSTIPAVRAGRLFGYGVYELLRPGPRIAETLEMVARFIHPEQFGPEDSTPDSNPR